MESIFATGLLIAAATINTGGSALMKYATQYKAHAGSKQGIFILLMFLAMGLVRRCWRRNAGLCSGLLFPGQGTIAQV